MRKLILLAAPLAVLLNGCMPSLTTGAMDTTGVITAKPAPFPHPGTFSGSAANGIVTYRIHEDGRGLSCFRNKLSGKMFFGDLKYDGERIHTEDGTVSVETVNEDGLTVTAPFVKLVLHRVADAPTVCRGFFGE